MNILGMDKQLSTHARCWWVYYSLFVGLLHAGTRILLPSHFLVETSETRLWFVRTQTFIGWRMFQLCPNHYLNIQPAIQWFLTLAHLMSVGGKGSRSKWGQSAWPWPWMFQAGDFSDKSRTHGYLPMVEWVSSRHRRIFQQTILHDLHVWLPEGTPKTHGLWKQNSASCGRCTGRVSRLWPDIPSSGEAWENQLAVGGGTVVNWCV